MGPLSAPVEVAAAGPVFAVLVVLHVVAALTGFVSTGLAGTYAARAGRALGAIGGRTPPADVPMTAQDLEELQRYFARPTRLWWALWAVPVLGAGALALKPGDHGLAQAWALAALGIWALALLLAGKVVAPGLAELGSLLAHAFPPSAASGPVTVIALTPEQSARAARAGAGANRAAAACDCLFFVALALMIWQP